METRYGKRFGELFPWSFRVSVGVGLSSSVVFLSVNYSSLSVPLAVCVSLFASTSKTTAT